MTKIEIHTTIKASKQIVFDISRNIDIHQQSAGQSNEKAIGGVTSGLIGYSETVTWRGRHFGFYLTHKSRITAMSLYDYFTDEMEEGAFSYFRHEHFFSEENGITLMTDRLAYKTPFGIAGKLFDLLFLEKHLRRFITERNSVLKNLSEECQLQQ